MNRQEPKRRPATERDQVPAKPTLPDRALLPLAAPTYPPITELDVRKTTPPPRFEVKAPKDAPNVLLILLDNLGFGATKTFGGVMTGALRTAWKLRIEKNAKTSGKRRPLAARRGG